MGDKVKVCPNCTHYFGGGYDDVCYKTGQAVIIPDFGYQEKTCSAWMGFDKTPCPTPAANPTKGYLVLLWESGAYIRVDHFDGTLESLPGPLTDARVIFKEEKEK